MFLMAWASGQMEIGSRLKKGALPIYKGSEVHCKQAMERGRLAYDNKTWLVPGVPEEEDKIVAVDALINFKKWATEDLPL